MRSTNHILFFNTQPGSDGSVYPTQVSLVYLSATIRTWLSVEGGML